VPNHNVGASNHHHFDIHNLHYQHVDDYHVNNNNGSANDNTATNDHNCSTVNDRAFHRGTGDRTNHARTHDGCRSHHHDILNFHHHIFNLYNCSGYNNDNNRTTNVCDC